MNVEHPLEGRGNPNQTNSPVPENEQVVKRDVPTEIPPARKALVTRWTDRVRRAKKIYEKPFRMMREDELFARGNQWDLREDQEDRYVVNVTLRHIKQRVAQLYAKDPRFVAKRRERLLTTVWDGLNSTLQQTMNTMQQGAMAAMETGDESLLAVAQQGMPIIQEAEQVKQQTQQLDKIAKTLELLFSYTLDEQPHNFKQMAKMVVQRSLTCGVGYFKLNYQRVMQRRPDVETKIYDITERLKVIERLAADQADEITSDQDAEAEQLRLLLQDLMAQPEQLVREGLVIDFPRSNRIIPDPACTWLPQFVGCGWVAEEFVMAPNEILETYGVDVSNSYSPYSRTDQGEDVAGDAVELLDEDRDDWENGKDRKGEKAHALVWEIYSKKDGLVFVVCEGYPEFLREPAAPDIWMERFWPWFVYAPNNTVTDENIFPPSDVRLIKDAQLELNRARQGLREHRVAARPKTVVSGNVLQEEDREKLTSHPANAILELNALQPGQKVTDVLQAWNGPGIDPNLYETSGAFQDILRTAGSQEANLGGISSRGTATESQIAEASRNVAEGSAIADLDDCLSEMARTGGQILLMEMDEQTVKSIVGEGAIWPQLRREELAKEIFLEIEAGSTGKPNRAVELSNLQIAMPYLMALPGLNPEWLFELVMKRLDDNIDLTNAFIQQLPSINMLNQAPSGAGAAGAVPGQPVPQEPGGRNNAPREEGSPAPRAPGPAEQVGGPPPGSLQ